MSSKYTRKLVKTLDPKYILNKGMREEAIEQKFEEIEDKEMGPLGSNDSLMNSESLATPTDINPDTMRSEIRNTRRNVKKFGKHMKRGIAKRLGLGSNFTKTNEKRREKSELRKTQFVTSNNDNELYDVTNEGPVNEENTKKKTWKNTRKAFGKKLGLGSNFTDKNTHRRKTHIGEKQSTDYNQYINPLLTP